MSSELHRDTVRRALGDVVALANIIEGIQLNHQVVHEPLWSRDQRQAVMASIDVHEICADRSADEVANPETKEVAVKTQRRVDIGNHQENVAHAHRAGAKAGNVARRPELRVSDLS